MSRTPDEQPSQSDFGNFIDEMTTAFGITGAQAIAIFGGTPNNRKWKEIMDDAKTVMKEFNKGGT